MWELTVSLKSLIIRIERKGIHGNLHVSCLGPIHIHGPVYWDDCEIEIVPLDHGFMVCDVRAGLEIHTENVSVDENCKPVFTPG